MTAMGVAPDANAKLARFRQLLAAKQLGEASSSPEEIPAPRAARSTTTDSARKSSGTTSRAIDNDGTRLNRTEALEREGAPASTATETRHQAGRKENAHPNNHGYAAIRRIMHRKQMATAARRELDSGRSNDNSHEGTVANGGEGRGAAEDDTNDSLPSAWAMLGNHLDESTLEPDSLALTPGRGRHDLYSLGSVTGSGSKAGGSLLGGGDGMSGVLSFLGESPLFDATVAEEDEAERNLQRSAEKVRRLEAHLLRGGSGFLSPVPPSHEEGNGDGAERERGVTFAIEGGWETPRAPSTFKYAQSPYVTDRGTMTPSKLGESMEAQVNPLNESVIVSDDEASGDVVGSPSPMKGIGSDAEEEASDAEGGAPDGSVGFELSRASATPVKQSRRDGRGNDITPTKASLMERNETLVKEVRFADQTCVELSERKKHYKVQAGQYKQSLDEANREKSLLRATYEASLQETARLKVLVESIGEQRDRADRQAEAYRLQIEDAERTHRSNLERMETTYRSHLKGSEEQVAGLKGQLRESLAANADLKSKLKSEATAAGNDASLTAMRARLEEMVEKCERQEDELRREKSEREMIEHDRDELRLQCDDLHAQLTEWVQTSDALGDVFFDNDGGSQDEVLAEEELEGLQFTPVKQLHLDAGGDGDAEGHAQTPTSNLLARTLRSELKRRQSVADRLEQAEGAVATLKGRIADMKMDYEEARADNALLEEDLEAAKEAVKRRDERIATLSDELEVLRQEDQGASSTSMESVAPSAADEGEGCGQEAESQGSSQRETRSMLEERLDAVEETLEFTDDELTETKARLADAQELLDQTSGDLERSEKELAAARERLSGYEARVDELFKDLTEKEVELANATKFSDFQSSTLEALKAKISKSDAVTAEQRAQLNSCLHSLVALGKMLKTYEGIDGVVGERLAEENRKVARLVATLRQFAEERGSTVDLESGELTTELTSLNKEVSQEAGKLREEISAIRLERDDANLQLEKAQACLQEFRDELAKQEGEHLQETASLKKQCVELEAKVSAVTAHLKACEIKSQKTENDHLQEKTSLEKQCEELETKLSAATSDLSDWEKKYQSLLKTSAAAESEVSQQLSVIRGNNAGLIQENEKIRVDLQGLQLELENERALLRSSREEADGFRQDVTNAKAAFECLTTECDLTKASLTKLESESEGLREALVKKEKDLKHCQEKLSTVQASFEEQNDLLKNRCIELETKLSVESNGRIAAEESLDEASKHIATLEDAINASQEEARDKQNECQELIVQIKQIQNALAEAEKERTEADGAIENLENQLHEKSTVLFAYEESIINYKNEIRRLGNELQTTVQEKNYRIQTLEQACTSRQTLFTEQLDRTKKERDASTAELTEMIQRLQDELQASNVKSSESTDRAKMAVQEVEEELLQQNEVQKGLEDQISRLQERLEEETAKHEVTRSELEEAHVEYARVTDQLSSMEMDKERVATMHQDDMEGLAEERNRLEGEKIQLEEEIDHLQASIDEAEGTIRQQSDEIERLSAQNASLEKKAQLFKEKVVSLTEKNQAWQDSYKAQGDDLVTHGIEISRLNGVISKMKGEGILSGRYNMDNAFAAQTPQGRTQFGHPGTM